LWKFKTTNSVRDKENNDKKTKVLGVKQEILRKMNI
jgi:hypothetical protein